MSNQNNTTVQNPCNEIILMEAEVVHDLQLLKGMENQVVVSPNKYIQAKNINEAWVITKRHNGNLFFKRNGYVTCLKNYPNPDCLYYITEDQAKQKVSELNASRKRCIYGYENASKYFVNNWEYFRYKDAIQNIPIPIKEVTATTKISTFEEAKNNYVTEQKRMCSYAEELIKRYKAELPIKIKQLEQQYASYEANEQQKFNQYSKVAEEVSNIQNSEVEKYETQGDRMVKVLYGAKK